MALQQSEKNLMAILGVALFGVINFVGYSALEDKKQEQRDRLYQLEIQEAEYNALNTIRPIWEERRSFLLEKCPQPSFVSEEAAAVEIEAHLKACALSAGVAETSLIIKPTEMISTANYNQVALNVNASGSAMSIMKLVSLIQAANHSNVKDGSLKHGFYAIPNIQFEADRKDPTILKCAFILARWYSPDGFSESSASYDDVNGIDFFANNNNNKLKLMAAK